MSRRTFAVLLAAAVGVKLWLAGGQALWACAQAVHDDQLFIRLAAHLANGAWLGPYDNLTLAKGPFYPFWIALVHAAGIPLLRSQHLVYASALLVLLIALKPWVPSRGVRLVFFIVLLFNPMTFSNEIARVMRAGIYPALTLLILAGWLGLMWETGRSSPRRWRWSVLLAAVLPAFWLTREEGVWLLPGAVVLAAAAAIRWLRQGRPDWVRTWGAWVLPWAALAVVIQGVAWVNGACYGVRTSVEFKAPGFTSAYGALVRVTPEVWRPEVPVARETLRRLYPLSPALAGLEPYLEGDLYQGWLASSNAAWNTPAETEIRGGYFMWLLRDAVARAGHCTSGAEAEAFYRQLAEEVNHACMAGQVSCTRRRAGMLPRWDRRYLPLWVHSFRRALGTVLRFERFNPYPGPSQGAPEAVRQFLEMTREPLVPLAGEPQRPESVWRRAKLKGLVWLGKIYGGLAPWLAGLAALGLILALGRDLRLRRGSDDWWVLTAVAVLLGTRLALISFFDVTSTPSLTPRYLAPSFTLFLLLLLLALNRSVPAVRELVSAIRRRTFPKPRK